MADFIFAIGVPLASPIEPVATQIARYDRKSLGAGGVGFSMVRVELGVNSGVCLGPVPAGVIDSAAQAGDDQPTPILQRKKTVHGTIYPTVSDVFLRPRDRAKFTAPVATGFVRQGSFH
jgi:hypothetical protein